MFSTISRDIEAVERHAAGKADRFTPRLTLRAEFDPKYSYPEARSGASRIDRPSRWRGRWWSFG